MKKTKWNLFKNFINQMKIGDIVHRQDLLFAQDIAFSKGLVANKGHWTFDSYLNKATQARYLTSTGRGAYKVLKHFPDDLSTSSLLHEYYEKISKYNQY